MPVNKNAVEAIPADGELLHPKYQLPARCFAYIGSASDTSTWKLPYRLADGTIDEKRLPKAIQALLSNYRGMKISSLPEEAVPAILTRLAEGAASIGRMPAQQGNTAPIYQQLAEVLEQIQQEGEKGSHVKAEYQHIANITQNDSTSDM